MLIDRATLNADGIHDEELIEAMLERAAVYEAKGVSDTKYILKAVKRDWARDRGKLGMRREPAPLSIALEEARFFMCPELWNVLAIRITKPSLSLRL